MKIKSNKNLTEVTEKAKIACKTARHAVADHLPDIWKMVYIDSGSERKITMDPK